MKLAVAGKGGVGKTSLTVWLGDYLARRGEEVWLVDADTALSLGQALGLSESEVPTPLIQEKDIILPDMEGIPPLSATITVLSSLAARQLTSPSVLDLEERELLDEIAAKILSDL